MATNQRLGRKYVKFGFPTDVAEKHSGEKPFKCIVCDKNFADGGSLRRHIVLSLKNQWIIAFSSMAKLTKHISSHTDEQLLKCHNCHGSFKDSAILYNHMGPCYT